MGTPSLPWFPLGVRQQGVADHRVQGAHEHCGAASHASGAHGPWLGGVRPESACLQESAECGPAGVGAGQRERFGDGLQRVAGERDHAEVRVELLVPPEDLGAVFDLGPVDPFGIGVDLLEQRHEFRRGVADALDAALEGLVDVFPGSCLALGRGEGGVDVGVAEPVPGVHGPSEGGREVLGDVEVAFGDAFELPLDLVRHSAVDGSEVRKALGDGYFG
jgi:hypothetical protein